MMDNFDNRPQVYGEVGIQSTAGAVPVKNDKGEISMQKVKVQRYISGKRPDYAQRYSSSEDESDEEDFVSKKAAQIKKEGEKVARRRERSSSSSRSPSPAGRQAEDPRLRRLQEPEVVEEEEVEEEKVDTKKDIIKAESDDDTDSDSSEEEMDEEQMQRRRDLMRQKAALKAQAGMVAQEALPKEEERSGAEDEEEEESSEEETDSEEEAGARLKPVFVRAKDRLTIQEREKEDLKAKQAEREMAKMAEERRRQTLRMVEDEVRKGMEVVKDGETVTLEMIETDDENDEVEYEAWKLREMRRLKRDREEAEAFTKEQQEHERVRNMTEEERRLEFQRNPKEVTNKAAKGKYKFMQKYYHRGAFFLDKEEDVLKRDTTGATLEDRFDKTVLPKVMQVKNFGRSSRTKYTHLVDQDTTQFDAAWAQESATNAKFINQHAGGMQQVFARPAAKPARPT